MFNRSNDGQRKVLCILVDFSRINQKIHCQTIISEALQLVDAESEFMWIRESVPEFDFTLDGHFFAPAYENIRCLIVKTEEIVKSLEELLASGRLETLSEDKLVVRYVLLDLTSTSTSLSSHLTSNIAALLVEIADHIQLFRSTNKTQVVALLPYKAETIRAISRHPLMVQREGE